jgi:hypothetical protein
MPRVAFVECSQRQADDFARAAERTFGRRVIGIDLRALQPGPGARGEAGEKGAGRKGKALTPALSQVQREKKNIRAAPASVRHVLTPRWHASEARERFDASNVAVFEVGVRITAACAQRLRGLAGKPIGLVVRDAESVPGFRERLCRQVGSRDVRVAVAGDEKDLAKMLAAVRSVVFTPPCADLALQLAGTRHRLEELVFEPLPRDLEALRARLFPALAAADVA